MSTDLAELFTTLECSLTGMFAQFDLADDEIAKAQAQHPVKSDVLHHSFRFLVGTHPRMAIDWVYQGHARELLSRVTSGQDLRLATAAELCLGFSVASLAAPLNTTGAGLYFRMWLQAFPSMPIWSDHGAQADHYEAIRGSSIDDAERHMRHACRQEWRRLVPKQITCGGRHHGEVVACEFSDAARGVLF